MVAEFPDLLPSYRAREGVRPLIDALSSGGDARITLNPDTGLNRYLAGPYPRKTIAFASSTANDISQAAFDHLLDLAAGEPRGYEARLVSLRERICAAYGLASGVDIVFAPSGTDLEFVALAAVAGRGAAGTHNILLGADEVGSGCILSARGQFFAGETALGVQTQAGADVAGIGPVSFVDVPVRCEEGAARHSHDIGVAVHAEIDRALQAGKHPLLHVVHGSKTGLILPKLREIDALRAQFGDRLSLVVDACQARITPDAVREYLDRDAIVFITGSKFMGGPPFSGFALVPHGLAGCAPELPAGFADIFRRAEWGEAWAGRALLADSENPGLAFRLEASIFELERFVQLSAEIVERVIRDFQSAVDEVFVKGMGFPSVLPFANGNDRDAAAHPLEMLTLATIDISSHPDARTFDEAQLLYRALETRGLRLGQPVKCVRKPGGEWGGTLRVGLSMPQVSELAALPGEDRRRVLHEQLERFAAALAVPNA
ncbi:MAG: hypothetical protein H6919_10020 [Sphingomonadaceae bacterium]|nr:hypothetical protein [Sphingomonadaceae bacterium]MCP5394227.1 hypothetical protein [Sphingomonadaceae bacterium]